MNHELFYEIALSQIDFIGPVRARRLIKYCGSAEGVFTESARRLRKIPSIGSKIALAVNDKQTFLKAEKELSFSEKHGTRIISYRDKDYPRRLKHCPDHPLVLSFKGDASLNPHTVVSIVGTRKMTTYGRKMCESIIDHLPASVQVVSGLAYGVDITIHRLCVQKKDRNPGDLSPWLGPPLSQGAYSYGPNDVQTRRFAH